MLERRKYYEFCYKELSKKQKEADRIIQQYDEMLEQNPDDSYAWMMRNQWYGRRQGLTIAKLIIADREVVLEMGEGEI